TAMPQPTMQLSNRIKIPAGTTVSLQLTSSGSSRDYTEGSIIGFSVVEPVKIFGVTVIAPNAPAKARITKAKTSGYWGRAGQLLWEMQDVLASDGETHIPLEFKSKSKGEGSVGRVVT